MIVFSNVHVQNLLNRILGANETGNLRRRLARGAIGSFGLKIFATGLAFATGVLLARILGAKGYGAYAFAIAWVQLLIIFGIFGLDRLLIRNIAIYRTRENWELMRGILRWSNLVAITASATLALLVAGIWWFLSNASPQENQTFLLALLLIPLMVITRLNQSVLRGLQYIVTGQVPEMLVRPLFFFLVIGTAYAFARNQLTSTGAMSLYIGTTFVTLGVSFWLLPKRVPQAVKDAKSIYQNKQWLYSAIPLLIVGGIRITNTKIDTIMLGFLQGTEWVGIYTAVNRAPELITFVLVAVNTALAPTIASLYAQSNTERMQSVVTKSAQVILIASVPIATLLILFSKQFLGLFGPEFIQGQTALIILCIAQSINAGMGSVGIILVNTGHERSVAIGFGLGLILNITLDFLLIPKWGLNGAAVASASSMILWNVVLVILVYKRLNIYSTAFGRISFRE